MSMERELDVLLKQGESEGVEFKETLDNEALETIAAFANTRGGILLIGVADDGRVKSVHLGKETLRDWSNRIGQATHVHPQIRLSPYGTRTVVLIEVTESPLKPVACRGRYFKRVGQSNRQMTDEDLTRAVLGKVGITWDAVVEPRATFGDLDPDQLRRFRVRCNQRGRRSIPTDEDDPTMLEKLGLLRDGQLLRAAVLLFGQQPQRFYHSAVVKIGRFRSPTLIVDDREVYGTLFDQVEETMDYFREHLQTRFEFHGEPAREVIWEYPLEALREAIINAVCHRDYLDTTHIQVRWYDDHLVLFNSGGLPAPLRLEDLKHMHPSVPRNHKMAEMFFYAGWIEQWGSGIQKMLDACASMGLPEPEFEERTGGLWVTFRKDLLTEEYLRSLELNERQIQGMLHVKERGSITNRAYRERIGVSDESARRDLHDLVRKGMLCREGKGRSVRYVLPRTWRLVGD